MTGFALIAVALLYDSRPARALDGFWQPPGIRPTQALLRDVLSAIERHRGPVAAAYDEGLHISAGGRTFPAQALVDGGDVRYTTVIDGATYASGRSGGSRWRRTPAGLVRTIYSDVQGDPLDRWPVAPLPIAPGDCALVGETNASPHLWVVQETPPRDIMHWLYVDETTGTIVREVTRDGSAEYTTEFGDEREAAGAQRPFRWTVAGFGGPATVVVDAIERRPADSAALTVPMSAPQSSVVAAPIRLPARFERGGITVDVSVNGRRSRFILDTGTTQILMTQGAAKRSGIVTVLDHGIAATLDAGDLHLRDQPIMTVPDIFGIDGLLGYDVFASGVVHIDFHTGTVELEPRAGFRPPADAAVLPTTFAEGMPLATATIGTLQGDRFALDTGSRELVLPRYLWEHRGLDASSLRATALYRALPHVERYLEGPIVTILKGVPDLQLGPVRVTQMTARVEKTNSGTTLNIPLDGIIGTDILRNFDYADGKTWMRLEP
jgi:hypothetical protein